MTPNLATLPQREWINLGKAAFEQGMRDAYNLERPRSAVSLITILAPPGYTWNNGHRLQLRTAYGAGYRIHQMNARWVKMGETLEHHDN